MQKSAFLFNSDSGNDTESTFRLHTERLAEVLKREGINRKPYSNPNVPLFNALTMEQKQNTLSLIKFYIDSLETLIDDGETLSNNATSLWAALKKLNCKPSSDFFNLLEDSDCIELYDMSHIQIWRNINMMKVMTHTLEQVFSLPWTQRYERDPAALEICVREITNVLQGKAACSRRVSVKNFLLEKDSTEMLSLDVLHKGVASVTNEHGNFAGYIIVSKVNVIGVHPQPEEKPNNNNIISLNI